MKLVGFTGYAQSGKDTAASFLVERGFRRYAFADILRWSLYNLNPLIMHSEEGGLNVWRLQSLVDEIGWDRAKVEFEEVRSLLQKLGTEVGRSIYGENFWVDQVMNRLTAKGSYVITDARFANEVQAIHDRGGKVFRIERLGIQRVNQHASEFIEHLPVDGVIPNTGDLEHFKENVLEAVYGT